MAREEAKKSTKVMMWIAGGFMTVAILFGIASGMSEVGESVEENNSSTQSETKNPF